MRSGAVSQLFFKHCYAVSAMYHFFKGGWLSSGKRENESSTKHTKHIQSCPGHPQGLKSHVTQSRGGLRLELGLHGTSSETENTSTVYIKELGGGTSDGNPLVTSILAQPGRDSIRNIHKLTSLWRAGPVVSILCTLNMLAHVNHTTTLLRKGLSSFPFYW